MKINLAEIGTTFGFTYLANRLAGKSTAEALTKSGLSVATQTVVNDPSINTTDRALINMGIDAVSVLANAQQLDRTATGTVSSIEEVASSRPSHSDVAEATQQVAATTEAIVSLPDDEFESTVQEVEEIAEGTKRMAKSLRQLRLENLDK